MTFLADVHQSEHDLEMRNGPAERTNLLVFRDVREHRSGDELCGGLKRAVQSVLDYPQDRDRKLDALIRAGEMESALADCESPSTMQLSQVTDHLASGLLDADDHACGLAQALQTLNHIALPEMLTASPPEGFAYYALHPMDLAIWAWNTLRLNAPAAVIGIRNIGATLSAVLTAALNTTGSQAQRITVRPLGHPYDRVTNLSATQTSWINQQSERSAEFFIVDEGPGLSGSSFLSVGEALVRSGVPAERITFVGTRQPDPDALCAADAAARWGRFQSKTVSPSIYTELPRSADLSGGGWRGRLLDASYEWPACWPQMERLKVLSSDGKWLLKFEGLGRFGREARERGRILASAGFSFQPMEGDEGLTAYPFCGGATMHYEWLTSSVLERMAEYCAFRARHFRVPRQHGNRLQQMLRFNVSQELGIELRDDLEGLESSTPILVDGRMQPWEWLHTSDGIMKVDACTHGDDHFFPGPTDIAWDLAGAIVEWGMEPQAIEFLTRRFQQLTGESSQRRLPLFLLAYTVFRMAYCKMALPTLLGTDEEARMRRVHNRYRQQAWQQLHDSQLSRQAATK